MTEFDTRGAHLRMPRSRGAASGLLLVLLGIWGALIPFVGSYFDFAFTPDQSWVWTTGRGWLEVLPGAATAIGGLLLLGSGNRATAVFGGWLAVLGGAWFVVGRALAGPLGIGDAGMPIAVTDAKRVSLELAYFSGLGALIVFLGAFAVGRLSVRSVRDVEFAQRPVAPAAAEPVGAAAAEPVAPAAAEPVAAADAEPTEAMAPPKHRAAGGLFGRRHTHAH
ncbi:MULTISPECIES: hypothetical protein [unclassified Mycolicibacterium]|uniref:hypothetical protein n=1 Tax=unclassified Mycolicibacterium TaxID=2636767 RepID=UPI0012DD616A|nr:MULTISPECIES: hypothetical protein [unclassified Mycolicibacterium]MUL84345.1 hypothetical protein [Mycolicibacterium sp. CBMA 329]MUL88120.1 hypothetical protein [Mycolicibacterium sp. CBMA 331]MUM02491.1 hypothetical protein [Mycolicibacterium sp. CBMA 334]MUM26033.1 hypothetical protein [Mycolicibacterium sp. CBMA 295]MUM39767.1 hypothetical protein [Mycolicibacterium sp. CBMA 247]